MKVLKPTERRLSPHFLLSDFLGCASVYARGLPNVFETDNYTRDPRIRNAQALCEGVLEPLLAKAGPLSISYGFLSPSLSRALVKYQDPDKPSHHRWDLGAAADVCVHSWVQEARPKDNTEGAPVLFALKHMQDLPLSRLITYSESPYICVAASEAEVHEGEPRMAWYENRYPGRPGKPQFLRYTSSRQRDVALRFLEDEGLPHHWQGSGAPTYHNPGRAALHYHRLSKVAMATDFLYDQEAVNNGWRNVPSLNLQSVAQAFQIAGTALQEVLNVTGLPRLSVVGGYTSHLSDVWVEGRDWRDGDVEFDVAPPSYRSTADLTDEINEGFDGQITATDMGDCVTITCSRDECAEEWSCHG